ncbi:MAG: tetratricopeptide repeat protein, partial [Candidatus Gastranaerophilaceae bacterium]
TTDSDIYVRMGNCFEKLGKGKTAIEYWQKAIDINPMNPNGYINTANYYFNHNETEKAISFWIASLIPRPENSSTNYNLAVAYTVKKMPIEITTYYEKYIKYSTDKSSKKYGEIQRRLDKNRNLANNFLRLGFQYQSNNDKVTALNCYEKSIKHYPLYSKAYYNLGALYYSDGNYDEAIRYWVKADYLNPNYPKNLSNLALTFDMQSKFDYAYCYYSKYLSFVKSETVEYRKIFDRLIYLKSFLKTKPFLIDNHLEVAKKAFANCDYRKAICEFQNYIILKPDENYIYQELINKIETYLSPEKPIIQMCIEKGRILFDKKQYNEATPYYERIVLLADEESNESINARRRLTVCARH